MTSAMPRRRGNPKARAAPRRPQNPRNQDSVPCFTVAPLRKLQTLHRFHNFVMTPSASDFGVMHTFRLNQFSSNEIAALYDSYRFREVVVTFSLANNVTTQRFPTVWFSADYDSTDAPPTAAHVAERNFKRFTLTPARSSFKVRLRPRPNMVMETSSSTANAGVAPRNTWLDCASPDIEHAGLKVWYMDWNSGHSSGLIINVMYDATIQVAGQQ